MSEFNIDIHSIIDSRINSKENVSNKVTSLSSSSTDTQYPSAKCVFDYIADLIGDIEEDMLL